MLRVTRSYISVGEWTNYLSPVTVFTPILAWSLLILTFLNFPFLTFIPILSGVFNRVLKKSAFLSSSSCCSCWFIKDLNSFRFLSYLPFSRFLWMNNCITISVLVCATFIFSPCIFAGRMITDINRGETRPYPHESRWDRILCIWEQTIYSCINCGNRIKALTCITERTIFIYIWNSDIQTLEQRVGAV